MAVRATSDDARRANASVRLLRREGFEADLPGLSRALHADDTAVRAEAAFVLGMQGSRDAVNALRQSLQDPAARVRVEAALALARLGEETLGAETLRAEMKGEFFADAPLRAARGLALLGDASGYERVLEALRSELPSNRMEAVAALPAFAGLPGVDPVEALTTASADSEELIRRDAEAALQTLREDQA